MALTSEAQAIQNPALGAVILWRFVYGHGTGSPEPRFASLHDLFIVLPIIFHTETRELVSNTHQGSGLLGFTSKFITGTGARRDLLLPIQTRALAMRPLSLSSIEISVATGLISLDIKTTLVRSSLSAPIPECSVGINSMIRASEKLGAWCGESSPFALSEHLRLEW